MIRLTRCTQASKAGVYFRLHLQTGDSPAQPIAPGLTLRPTWIGTALPEVKLHPFEPPVASHLVRLGRGLHPLEKIRLAPSKGRKRAYYDVTVSSPKTISLLSLLEPTHPIAKSVMRAHMEAVEFVARAAGKLIKPQNARGAAKDKWLGVLFHHTHTREGDPHLHSHIILPNLMLNRAGQWRAMQVVIAGPARLQLGLLYGHALAGRLRRLGFGDEIRMRPSGVPEIGSLEELALTFSKARRAILLEDARSAKRPTQQKVRQQGSKVRVFPPGFYDQDKMKQRARVADDQRKPKPKAADNPVKLAQEAERWTKEVSPQDYRRLLALLDSLDYTNPRRLAVIRKDGPPPPTRDLLNAAAREIPEGAKVNTGTLMRAAVALSAGRHTWNELLAATRAKLERRKKALARIRAENDAISIALAEARIATANRPPVVLEGEVGPVAQTQVAVESVSEDAQAAVESVSEDKPSKRPRARR